MKKNNVNNNYEQFKKWHFLNRRKQIRYKYRDLFFWISMLMLFICSVCIERITNSTIDPTIKISLMLVIAVIILPLFITCVYMREHFFPKKMAIKKFYFSINSKFILQIFNEVDKDNLSFYEIQFIDKTENLVYQNINNKDDFSWIRITTKNDLQIYFGSSLIDENKSVLIIDEKIIELNDNINLSKIVLLTRNDFNSNNEEELNLLNQEIINKINDSFAKINNLIIEAK
ncbi:hypothetical protein [Mesomycoplasma lagogenitalium]|uniref:DUF3137 domain-containing protein n=1 Tax=Mesomycoplasma lagogenitalium TaxID=171286 RepID=A0ABY8LUP6_9BACT|nr:hypothetical protein [Mesomycoplasma lagogenitalium]WGI36268.1 hypothetical protein QEG99_02195 [Mesomycoplasma lagogenitalium]